MSPSSGPANVGPLSVAPKFASLNRQPKWDSYQGQVSKSSFHVFINSTSQPLDLMYFYGEPVVEVQYGTIQPGSNLFIGTYEFHKWKVKSKQGDEVATYSGPSAVVNVSNSGFTVEPSNTAGQECEKFGAYRRRGAVLGMEIMAYDCVSDDAVSRLTHIVSRMLALTPKDIISRMLSHNASFAVVGRNQVVSDMPPHKFMRYSTGRNIDKTSRGLGGTTTVPVTTCGEENLTMVDDKLYSCQSILVHELGHAVQNLGLSDEQIVAVCNAYDAALKGGTYPANCYMMTNEQEYWASAVEAWFEATIRTDVNGGMRTRQQLRERDPNLACVLEEVFGDGPWRYQHDSPAQLVMPYGNSSTASAASASGGGGSGSMGGSHQQPSSPKHQQGAAAAGQVSPRQHQPAQQVQLRSSGGASASSGGGGQYPHPSQVPQPPYVARSGGADLSQGYSTAYVGSEQQIQLSEYHMRGASVQPAVPVASVPRPQVASRLLAPEEMVISRGAWAPALQFCSTCAPSSAQYVSGCLPGFMRPGKDDNARE